MTRINSILFCLFGLSLFIYGSASDDDINDYTDYGDGENAEIPQQSTAKPRPTVSSPPTITSPIDRETSQVAAILYKGVDKTETKLGNFVMSPLSLTTMMVMLNAGARGETAREIQHLFKFEPDSDVVIDHAATLFVLQNQAANETSGVELVTASRIFANSANANILPDYTEEVSFLSEVETFSFADRKRVVEKTNEWVKNRTGGKISKLVEEKDFTDETAAVLLDAVYFKAPWKTPFNISLTKKAHFHVNENKAVQVDMMHIYSEFPYADLSEVEATAIFLPYKGDRMNMIIYFPWKRSNLSSLEGKLENLILSEVRLRAQLEKVALSLPKFNISSSLDLKPVLTSLGVQKMFNRTVADFSKMSTTPEFHVSKVRQQVFIEVNEEGTEAAGATVGFGVGPTSVATSLIVNRPFMFQIFDEFTHKILLSGRITNPNGTENAGNVQVTTNPPTTNPPTTNPPTTNPPTTNPPTTNPPTTNPPTTNPPKTREPTTSNPNEKVPSGSGPTKSNFMALLLIFCQVVLGLLKMW